MTNFNTLEELRTKEELVNYFAQRGQSITEEEIETLKKSYGEADDTNGALSLEQLDDVAGGNFTCIMTKVGGLDLNKSSGKNIFHLTINGKSVFKDKNTGEKFCIFGGSDNSYEKGQFELILEDHLTNKEKIAAICALRKAYEKAESISFEAVERIPIDNSLRDLAAEKKGIEAFQKSNVTFNCSDSKLSLNFNCGDDYVIDISDRSILKF